MECRSDRGIQKREPRPDCNEGKSPKEVVPEDFNEGVSAAKLLVEGNISEAPSLVQLQKIAERTLESYVPILVLSVASERINRSILGPQKQRV